MSLDFGGTAWPFCGSERGGERAAILYAVIQNFRFTNVDPQARLADALTGINNQTTNRLNALLVCHCAGKDLLRAAEEVEYV